MKIAAITKWVVVNIHVTNSSRWAFMVIEGYTKNNCFSWILNNLKT